MKTVQRLEAVRTDNNDRPVEDIKIHKARLGEGGSLGSDTVDGIDLEHVHVWNSSWINLISVAKSNLSRL